jgi:hypothetical protein
VGERKKKREKTPLPAKGLRFIDWNIDILTDGEGGSFRENYSILCTAKFFCFR